MAEHKPRALDGKLAIVTGASRGIGRAIASNLAAKGAILVLNYTSESSASKTSDLAAELDKQYGTKSIIVQADLGATDCGVKIVQAIKESPIYHNTSKLQVDILINNAGVSINYPIEEVDEEKFMFQYRINVLGPLLLVKELMPYFPHDYSGRIVNVSSVSSSMGCFYQSIYGGTKAALDAMGRTWARELIDRCTVNMVNPGPVQTDMFGGVTEDFANKIKPFLETSPGMNSKGEKLRGAYPEEIANVVGLLCLPESQWTNGSVISCNGGLVMGH